MSSRPDTTAHVPRLLIVDDEPNNLQVLQLMLKSEGFHLSTAASGEEALASVAQDPPDLILLDIMMPGMGGCAVAETLKGNSATKSIPIIMVSAHNDREARLLGLNAGAEDFLMKPVDRAELRVRVRNLLRLKAYGDYHDKYSQMLEGEVGLRTADLVESERLYRSTFDAAPVGIVHVGLDGRWLRVNQRLCDLLGYTRQELQDPAIQQQLASDTEGEAEVLRRLAAGTLDHHVVHEKAFRHKNGGVVWARVNMSVHGDGVGHAHHFILVIEDITASRVLEVQVLQANKMDAIGRLASGIAHDFNNLMSVVLSYSDLLSVGLMDGDPMREDLSEIKGAGLRAVELTRQLLAFSREQVLEPKIVDLSDVLGGMEKMLRRLLGEDVELVATRAVGIKKILIDPGQMEQVIMNLAVNARDAMARGGRLSIETSDVMLDEACAAKHVGVTPGPHVMLVVSDTGTGMDAVTQARIFEPFFTTKEAGKGTGLGLATVFGIVKQSGGTIWVYSEPGKGTTFKVYFPALEGGVVALAAPALRDGAMLRGSETILLVEDEERVRVVVRTILRGYGYNVLDTPSGGDAILLCEQHTGTIDLLLTDVVMPRMSGRELANRLSLLHRETKVLYMSGYMDDSVMRHGVEDATSAFLSKPITPEVLARKVRAVLDGT